MELGDVAVATITWARTDDEEQALRRALQVLVAHPLPIVVADRPTRPRFTDFLGDLPRVDVRRVTDAGLPAQIAAALDGATRCGTRFVLYTEPDKEAFFRDDLAGFVRAAPDVPGVGVVLASRSARSFATFPPMQHHTESVVNDLCRDVIGTAGDYTYGPFLMDRALARAAVGLDPRLGWGWRMVAFRNARRIGSRVCHVEGDYRCPPEQQAETDADRAHRLAQMRQNIAGLLD